MKTLTQTTNDPATENDSILIKKKELAKRLTVSSHTVDEFVGNGENLKIVG